MISSRHENDEAEEQKNDSAKYPIKYLTDFFHFGFRS